LGPVFIDIWQLNVRDKGALKGSSFLKYTRVHSGIALILDTQVHGQNLYIRHSAIVDRR